jgi:hypothetical protein
VGDAATLPKYRLFVTKIQGFTHILIHFYRIIIILLDARFEECAMSANSDMAETAKGGGKRQMIKINSF